MAITLNKLSKFSEITNRIIQCGRARSSLGKVCADEFVRASGGVQLLSPTRKHLNPFKYAIEKLLKLGIPKDIKGVLIGHGQGSFKDGTWKFCETGQNVIEYLSKMFKKGEKVLVLTCETANNAAAKTPGIGNTVIETLDNPMHLAKIVEIGKGIIGDFVNGITTYYKK